MSHTISTPIPSTSIEAKVEWEGNVCVLTYDTLDVHGITSSVGDDGAGATVVFIGTTRNSFKGREHRSQRMPILINTGTTHTGKVVTRLEYQAYSKLAIRTMADIVRNTYIKQAVKAVSGTTHSPIRYAIHHRLGVVPVGEASIVIAVSSPHRKEAFLACEQILEEVKQKVPIWKREYYEGEDEKSAEWKANYS